MEVWLRGQNDIRSDNDRVEARECMCISHLKNMKYTTVQNEYEIYQDRQGIEYQVNHREHEPSLKEEETKLLEH